MHKGAITVVTISGVPVRVHWTFLVLLAWVFGEGFLRNGSLTEGLTSVVFIASVFACVVAHEFGHILAARYFGVRTRDVTLLPIGGVATLERIPETPWKELVVAIAGPLVNIVIAAALLPGLLWRGGLETITMLDQPRHLGQDLVVSLAVINVSLVLFNMIPAFPMDGGRVLRAVLAMFTDRLTATRAAATVGRVLAVCMALVGIFAGMPMLLILALFVFVGAGVEAAGTEASELLHGLPVSAVMVREFHVLTPADTLQTAVDELLANTQCDFPITQDGTRHTPVVGLLTRVDLIAALANHGPSAPVSAAMRSSCPPAQSTDPARRIYQELQVSGCPLIPVIDQGILVGLVTAENIGEAILVRGALRQRPAPRGPSRERTGPSAPFA